MTNKNHQPRFAYIAPTYSQAKKIAWDYLKHYTKNLPNTKYNETELRADFLTAQEYNYSLQKIMIASEVFIWTEQWLMRLAKLAVSWLMK